MFGQASAEPASVRELAADLFVVTAGDTNVVALTGSGGAVLVDGGSKATGAALRGAVIALPGSGAIHTLFNTHWHPEQTGSNETLAAAGAAIIAQENTKLWLSTDVTWPWNGETVEPLPVSALAWWVPPARFVATPLASAARAASIVAPTERRARSTSASVHGKPISRCCAAPSVPLTTAER